MSGTRLKSDKLKAITVERVKWVFLLLLSHVLVWLLTTADKKPLSPIKKIPKGFVHIQLVLDNQVPLKDLPKKILIIDKNNRLLTREAVLIKKEGDANTMGSLESHFLVEFPESDLENLMKVKNSKLFAYPASHRVQLTNKQRRNYEITF